MNVSIILSAAKLVHVSGVLLLAICSHESGDFKHTYVANDGSSPSFGICQLKMNTAEFMGFDGTKKELMDPKTNAYWAAKYLKYQQNKYGNNWVMMTAAYNSGKYNESDIVSGCPRNLKYIKHVQKKLPSQLRYKLNCGEKK